MAIIRFNDATLSFGEKNLLDKVNFSIAEKERVCIVGRNGTGKSTILKVIDGLLDLDAGSLTIDNNTIIRRLQQEPPASLEITVYDYLVQALGEATDLLSEYHHLINELTRSSEADSGKLEALNRRLAQVQFEIEEGGYWELDREITKVATHLEIPLETKLSEFSGGWLRRIELARCLVAKPNVLLLDEPTNHLDITAIKWLETELLKYQGTIIFISHDRTFVNHLATRIIEIDRGQVYSHPGSFEQYLELRDKRLADEKNQVALFEKNLAKEEVWIRKGIEARRTRNEGRVRALKAMRIEHQNLRRLNEFGEINTAVQPKGGKLVLVAENLGLELGEKWIFRNFSHTVARGSCIAIVGENGSGKTSLLRTLLQELEPTEGSLRLYAEQIAYFDQLRVTLDPEKTVIDNVFDGKMEAMVNGHLRHAIGYLQDFLFTAEKARAKVSVLSGGERNRLLLAKLLAKPSTLLVLDEPTNDLDIETLELLEEVVGNYQGTVILVSHDRSFIDNLALETWFIEQGKVWTYVGSYSDNVENHERLLLQSSPKASTAANRNSGSASSASITNFATSATNIKVSPAESGTANSARPQLRSEKLSYKEKQDLEQIPLQLEEIETKIADLNQLLSTLSDYQEIESKSLELDQLLTKQEELEERWLELEEKRERIGAKL